MIVRSFRSEVVLVSSGQVFPTADLRSQAGMFRLNTFPRLVRWRGASNHGFTLVELLVVIAVIAVLAALAMGGASRMSESAAISKSANQMLQLGRAAHAWAADNNGRLPTPGPPATWYEQVYPYIYNSDRPQPFFQPNDKAENLRGTVFWCPLRDRFDEGPNKRSYGWNTYVKDMTKPEPRPPLAMVRVKQPSKTMMLATSKNGSVVNGTRPDTWNLSDRCGGQVLIVFIDGHLEKRALAEIPTSNTNVFWRPE